MKNLIDAATGSGRRQIEPSLDSNRKLELTKLVKVLFACYRRDDTHDPEVYFAAVVSVLAAYSLDVARRVCDPREGLPSRSTWLPSVAEVKQACEQEIAPLVRERERQKQVAKQLAEREDTDRSKRLNIEELKAKYGDWTKGEHNPLREIKPEDVGRFAQMFVGPQSPNWPIIKRFVETGNLSPLDWRHGTFKSIIDNETHVGLYVRLDHYEKLVGLGVKPRSDSWKPVSKNKAEMDVVFPEPKPQETDRDLKASEHIVKALQEKQAFKEWYGDDETSYSGEGS